MTPEEIQQARELAPKVISYPYRILTAEGIALARAVRSLTEQLEQARGATEQWKSCFEALTRQKQQSESVSRDELADAIVVGLNVDEPVSGFAYEAAGALLSRYIITRKQPAHEPSPVCDCGEAVERWGQPCAACRIPADPEDAAELARGGYQPDSEEAETDD